MKPINLGKLCAFILTLTVFTSSNGALVGRLPDTNGVYQAVYDSDLNITWLANANLAATNAFGVSGINSDGSMPWPTAQDWIVAMNSAKYLGFSDWRIPSTLQPDPTCLVQIGGTSFGTGCTGSEMGHLYYIEFGGILASEPFSFWSSGGNLDQFFNIQSRTYWSGELLTDTTSAWFFDMYTGMERTFPKSFSEPVWAVRTGDVTVAPLIINVVIKPNSTKVNLKEEIIKVAILTGGSFDAIQVNPATVKFGPAHATIRSYHVQDVDDDGDVDMVLTFTTFNTGIVECDTAATLTGNLYDGTAVKGSVSFITKGCLRKKQN